MDLDLVEYQELMVKTFGDFFARNASAEAVRSAEGTNGFDAQLWRHFVELGGPSLSIQEDAGGGGGTLVDAALVGIESGRRLAPMPYAEAVTALRLLAGVAGSSLLTVLDPTELAVYVPEASLSWRADDTLDGFAPWVRGGGVARFAVFVVDGRVALVDMTDSCVELSVLDNLGKLPLAMIRLTGATPMATFDLVPGLEERATSELRLLQAAELTGAGLQALALGLEYVRERKQFDRAIGSFQAIQHRLADRVTALDAAELLVSRAASYGDEPEMLRYYSSVALLQACEAAELAAKESLQFFGGYGFMLEYDIHLYLRFVKSLSVLACHSSVVEDALPARLRVLS